MNHFTGTSDPRAEELLATSIPQLADDIKALGIHELLAICLGGGYGRGEGGVRTNTDGSFTLYNDLDLFTIVRTETSKHAREHIMRQLDTIGQRWSKLLKVDVEFSAPLTLMDLNRNARKLMMQELVRGHVVLCGAPDIIRKAIPILPAETMPKIEAIRLMFNRGMGLLFAHEHLNTLDENAPQDEVDFINRNINKCLLGIGDSWLMMTAQYRWGIEERAALLEQLNPDALGKGFPTLYRNAVQRKFTPESNLQPQANTLVSDLRERWLRTLCDFLGQPTLCIKEPEVIDASLHLFCRRNHLCGLRNCVRWLIRTGDADISRTAFDEPLTKALALLFRAHVNTYRQQQEFHDADRAKLQKLWQLFN